MHNLFDRYFAAADEAYWAFHEWESVPGNLGRADLEAAAHAAKDRRTAALNDLMAELHRRGCPTLVEGVARFYRPAG
jgi:hypothetical protein